MFCAIFCSVSTQLLICVLKYHVRRLVQRIRLFYGLAGLNSQTNSLLGGSGAKPPTGSRGANRMFAQLPQKRRTDAPQHRATGSTLLSLFKKHNLFTLQSKRNPHCKVSLGKSGLPPPSPSGEGATRCCTVTARAQHDAAH